MAGNLSLSEVPHDAAVLALLEQLEQRLGHPSSGERARTMAQQADDLERIAELRRAGKGTSLAD